MQVPAAAPRVKDGGYLASTHRCAYRLFGQSENGDDYGHRASK